MYTSSFLSFLPSRLIDCEYDVFLFQNGNAVQFYVSSTTIGEKDWIGVGFNRGNTEMKGTDIILGYFDNDGKGVIKDYYYAESGNIAPKEDESQDVMNSTSTLSFGIQREDGNTFMEFIRKIGLTNEVSLSICFLNNLNKKISER